MSGQEYSKLQYCDLLVDLEKLLGIDSTLLGLERVDFDYDETMRYWVGRHFDEKPIKPPNPSESLFDMSNVSFDWNDNTPLPAEDENPDNLGIAHP